MLNRRQIMAGAAASAVAVTTLHSAPAAALVPPVQADPLEHLYRGHLFASTRIPGANWADRSITYSIDEEMKAQGFEAEVIAAVMSETVATIEHHWIEEVRDRAVRVGMYDEQHEMEAVVRDDLLSKKIQAAGEGANVAILSPTALTITMNTKVTSPLFEWRDDNNVQFGMKQVGVIGHLKILCNQYARDIDPILIGHVPEAPEDRKGAIIRKGRAGFEFGSKPGLHDNWKMISMHLHRLIYI